MNISLSKMSWFVSKLEQLRHWEDMPDRRIFLIAFLASSIKEILEHKVTIKLSELHTDIYYNDIKIRVGDDETTAYVEITNQETGEEVYDYLFDNEYVCVYFDKVCRHIIKTYNPDIATRLF